VILTGFLIAMVLGFQQPEPQSWRSIVPLVTTRSEVEKILGPSQPSLGPSKFILHYDTPNETITITYGGVRMNVGDPCKWSVAPDVVLEFTVTPLKDTLLRNAGMDLTKFRKYKDREMEIVWHYYDPEDGISIETQVLDGIESVRSYEVEPNSREIKAHCGIEK
jgi:hypothetical protein